MEWSVTNQSLANRTHDLPSLFHFLYHRCPPTQTKMPPKRKGSNRTRSKANSKRQRQDHAVDEVSEGVAQGAAGLGLASAQPQAAPLVAAGSPAQGMIASMQNAEANSFMPRNVPFGYVHTPTITSSSSLHPSSYTAPQPMPTGNQSTSAASQIHTQAALTSICDPLGCNVSSANKEKIWRGEFIELGSLLKPENPGRTDQQQHWAFSAQGPTLVAQPAEESGKEVKGIFAWTNAFLIFASVYLEKHPDRAQDMLKYTANIREFAQKMPSAAWLKYDHDFRRKMARNPQSLWSTIDMELYAKMLLHNSPVAGPRGIATNVRQNYTRTFRPSQGRPCYAFNSGTCTKTDSTCTYAHKCMHCQKPGHPRGKCFQLQNNCTKCGKKGHVASRCNKSGPINSPSAKITGAGTIAS